MQLIFCPFTADDVREFTQWRYDPPYDIYNFPHPPTPADLAEWLDPNIAGHAMRNARDEMIGFCTFGLDGQVPGGDYSADALDIGMGIRPDHTGGRLGKTFAQAVIDFAQQKFDPPVFRVTIATFNGRAVKVWTKCGFEPREKFMAKGTQREFQIFTKAKEVGLKK